MTEQVKQPGPKTILLPSLYTAIEQQTTPAGLGPYVAY